LPILLLQHGFRPVFQQNSERREIVAHMLDSLFNGGYSLDEIATAIAGVQ
jgi:hypothetical protein